MHDRMERKVGLQVRLASLCEFSNTVLKQMK